MVFLNVSHLFVILFSLGLLCVFGGQGLAMKTAVHVYFGCVNVIPITEDAKAMALCAEKGPRTVYDNSAIIQAGFVDHMDDWVEDYPRLEQLITWPPDLQDVYIGGDLCLYPQQYRITYDAPNAIFKQCITQYYNRAFGKVSNPYYVWYHNKDQSMKADAMDGSDSLLTAGNGNYQEYTATPLEFQVPDFSINDGDQLLGNEADEGNLFALTGSTNDIGPDDGYEDKSQDNSFLSLDGSSAGTDDDNIFAVQPPSTGNDLDKLFTLSSADEEEFRDSLFLS